MPSMKPSRRLDLSVQYAAGGPRLPDRASLRRWARAALEGGGTVTIRLVDEPESAALNLAYRQRDKPTNVLSFPYERGTRTVGDLVVCVPVVEAEATAQGKSLEAHFVHMVVHGMLHLQGFDHEEDGDALEMENRERVVMSRLGFPDPYADD